MIRLSTTIQNKSGKLLANKDNREELIMEQYSVPPFEKEVDGKEILTSAVKEIFKKWGYVNEIA